MNQKISITLFFLFLMTGIAIAQEGASTPTTTPLAVAVQMDQLQQQIDLMKKQQEYEKAKSDLANVRLREIMRTLPANSSLKLPEDKTTFTDVEKASPESASLSYVALKELSVQIETAMRPSISRYAGIVIYNEPDFAGLAKYRLYRNMSDTAVKNYEELTRFRLRQVGAGIDQPKFHVSDDTKSFDPVTTILSLPAIGSSFVRSVADLLSVFRTETTIYENRDTVDTASLGTAIANELKKAAPNLKIYYPLAFVPEYDLQSQENDSVLARVAAINAARADLADFLGRCDKLDAATQNDRDNKELIARVRIVKKQLDAVAIGDDSDESNRNSRAGTADNDPPQTGWNNIRQLVRAEKLDGFMRQGSPTRGSSTGPAVGILKLRVLASGGSRRETRNLFLGNKVSYSGSVTLEVLLFDIDGTLQMSQIFSQHTGFRKLKTTENK